MGCGLWAVGCGLLLAALDLKIVRPHSDCNKTKVTALQYSRSASTLGLSCKNYNNLNTLPQNAKFTKTIHTHHSAKVTFFIQQTPCAPDKRCS